MNNLINKVANQALSSALSGSLPGVAGKIQGQFGGNNQAGSSMAYQPQAPYGAPPGQYGAPQSVPPGYGYQQSAPPPSHVGPQPPYPGSYMSNSQMPPSHLQPYGAAPSAPPYGAGPGSLPYGAAPGAPSYGAAPGAPPHPPHQPYASAPPPTGYPGAPPGAAHYAPHASPPIAPPGGQYGAHPVPYGGYYQQGHSSPPHNPYGTGPTPAHQHSYASNPQAINMPPTGQHGLPVVPGGHVDQYPQTFKVEERVLSATQDSFDIKDATNGMLRYRVEGSFTINERKTMTDMHGSLLLRIKEARLQLKDKITIMDGSNTPLVTIQQAGFAQYGAKKALGYIGGTTSGVPVLNVNGNKDATHFRITTANGQDVCVVYRKGNSLKHRLTGQDSYETTVMPGVDQALMCMITVAIDELFAD